MSNRESGKARHYLDLLDQARCSAQWHDVPELCRKVSKHAPHRRCLVLTAEIEQNLTTSIPQRPTTAKSSHKSVLSDSLEKLQDAVEKETLYEEDAFQARICSAWAHYTFGENALALKWLPSYLEHAPKKFSEGGGISAQWTHVGIVKGTYLRGSTLEQTSKAKEAFKCYESALPYLSSLSHPVRQLPEHRTWTERLLSRLCLLSGRHVSTNSTRSESILAKTASIPPEHLLSPFRAWAQSWEEYSDGSPENIMRAGVWRSYYDTLSVLLQNHIVEPIFQSRGHQCAEAKKVESIYEAFLLRQTRFPKANEDTRDIDAWVDQVVANWRSMTDARWIGEDTVKGGRPAIHKSAIDVCQSCLRICGHRTAILYRAAARSFHSARILRHLFTLHTATADFNLASKAFDAYLDIMKRGKARRERSGERDAGLDDDETSLYAVAAGLKMLCYYGSRKDIEQAQEITGLALEWLSAGISDVPPLVEKAPDGFSMDSDEHAVEPKTAIHGKAIAQGYYAVGLCKAQWARLTYQATNRTMLQGAAIAAFRSALRSEFGDERNVETLFALAFVLAETRDLDGAIISVKEAIAASTSPLEQHSLSQINSSSSNEPEAGSRLLLLRCWHLLSLLLSARHQFSLALKSFDAAFDLYGSRSALWGEKRLALRDLKLSIDEKRELILLEISNLSLLEVLDDAEEVVNYSGELLSLYSHFYRSATASDPPPSTQGSEAPSAAVPEKSKGTRDSLLPQSIARRRSKLALPLDGASHSAGFGEAPVESTTAPAISVTSESDKPLPQDFSHQEGFLGRHESNKLRKRPSKKSVGSTRRSRTVSPARSSIAEESNASRRLTLGAQVTSGARSTSRSRDPKRSDGPALSSHLLSPDEIGVAMTHDMPSVPSTPASSPDPPNPFHNISSAADNMDKVNPNPNPIEPKPAGNPVASASCINLFPSTSLPVPDYPAYLQERQAASLLSDIWVYIASLYIKTKLITEAEAAITEAKSQVEAVERSIAANDGSSCEKFTESGRGGWKSCGELWGGLFAMQAKLYDAQGNTERAQDAYESALSNCPDHVAATVGLCTILLSKYSTKAHPGTGSSDVDADKVLGKLPISAPLKGEANGSKTTVDLIDISGRDRAYGLLLSLTKSGRGWDNSEAWYALACAYEQTGQLDKAREAFWWVVRLEEGTGVRPWAAILA